MTHQLLSSLAGITLSLIFSYIPGISSHYEALTATYKRLVMLFLLAVVSTAAFGLACLDWLPFFYDQGAVPGAVTCTEQGGVELLTAFILALVANQSTYLITPKKEVSTPVA